jgi:signal transduction histidine kinase
MAGALLEDDTNNQIWFAMDNTAQKQLEHQREKFMNMAGHELRNPLAAIKGYLELLQRKLHRAESSDQVRISELLADCFAYIDRALGQVKSEARLIDDLIDVARATTDHLKLDFKLQPFDVLVQETIDGFRLRYPERELRLQCQSSTPVTVLLDGDRIKQVINNLLTNAHKYSPAEWPIDVRLSLEHRNALLEVQDYGKGLSKKDQQSIWQPYHQASKAVTPTSDEVGLGLGLVVIQKIIAEHHGQIGIDSTPGHGSTFWFTLPQTS